MNEKLLKSLQAERDQALLDLRAFEAGQGGGVLTQAQADTLRARLNMLNQTLANYPGAAKA